MEGHLPCIKFLVGEARSAQVVLHARNDNGDTPKQLAQQFYKDSVIEYCDNIEWEQDHPEEAESRRILFSSFQLINSIFHNLFKSSQKISSLRYGTLT